MEWGLFGRKSIEFITRPIKEDKRIEILEGSVRSGKTITLLPKLLKYIKDAPNGLIAITGVSKQTIYDNILRDLFETVGNSCYKYNSQTGDLTIFNRPFKVIGAKDEGSEKYLRGKTLAGAFCDELTLMPKNFFEQLLNRLSIKGAKLYGTTNPDSPYHYLYTDYITDEEKIKKGIIRTTHFDLDDNPNLSDEYKDFIKSAYSGLFYKRAILGLWVLADGIIYPEFDENLHCITIDQLPDRFDRMYVSVDYGITNPTVYLKSGLKYINGQPHFYIIDEYYNDGKGNKIKTDLLFLEDYFKFTEGDLIESTIIDPSATSIINLFRQHNISVRSAKNDVLDGINCVATWLKQERIHIVKDRCPNLIKEFASYIWDAKKSKLGEDAPSKVQDHAQDCARYLLFTLFPTKGNNGIVNIVNL